MTNKMPKKVKKCRKCHEPLGELQYLVRGTGMWQCLNQNCSLYGQEWKQ